MTDNKAPLRLRGILRIGERGPVLEVVDGSVWWLDTTEDLRSHENQPIQIEAWQRGTGRLELLWIGPVTT